MSELTDLKVSPRKLSLTNMNESSSKGLLGVVTTTSSTIVAWLPTVNIMVQIVAGCVAIVAGIITARYYLKKIDELK